VSDRRRPRTQAVSDDVHKSTRVKTETLSGGSLDSLVEQSRFAAVEDGELVMDWREFQARVGD